MRCNSPFPRARYFTYVYVLNPDSVAIAIAVHSGKSLWSTLAIVAMVFQLRVVDLRVTSDSSPRHKPPVTTRDALRHRGLIEPPT